MWRLWARRYYQFRRSFGFFLISLSHNTLVNYYKINFALMQYHKYSLSEIESMMPWEREIYIQMLLDYLENQKNKNDSS